MQIPQNTMNIPHVFNTEVFETEADLIIRIQNLKKKFMEDHGLDSKEFNKKTSLLDSTLSKVHKNKDYTLTKNPIVFEYKPRIKELEAERDKKLREAGTQEEKKELQEHYETEIDALLKEKNILKEVHQLKLHITQYLKDNADIPLTVVIDSGKFGTKYSYHEIDEWGRISFKNFISGYFPSRLKAYSMGMAIGADDESLYLDGEEFIIGPSSDRIYGGHTDVNAVTTKAAKEHRILLVNALDKIYEKTNKVKFNVILCYSADQYGTDKGAEVALTVLNLLPSKEEMDRINSIVDSKKRSDELTRLRQDAYEKFPIKIGYEKDQEEREVTIYDIITTPETLSGILSNTVKQYLKDKELKDVLIKDIGGLNSTFAKINNGSIGSATIIPDANGMIDVYSLAVKYIKKHNSPNGGLSIKTTESDIERILTSEIPEIYAEEYDAIYKRMYQEKLKEVQAGVKAHIEKEKKSNNTKKQNKEIKIPKVLNKSDAETIALEADKQALLATHTKVTDKYRVLNAFFNEYLGKLAEDLHDPDLTFDPDKTELVFIGGGSSELRVFIYNYFTNIYPRKLAKDVVIPKDNDHEQLIYANAEGSYTGFFGQFSSSRKRRLRDLKNKQKQAAAAL